MSALLHARVTEAASANADRVAVVMGGEQLSYAQLEARSDRLAGALVAAGVERGDRVALVQPKAPAAIVSMLAVLKAGGIYVPVDPASPAPRAQRVLDRAEPSLVLAAESTAGLLAELVRLAPVGCVAGILEEQAFGPREIAATDALPHPAPVDPGDPAHLLFTSGSTGEPKGVVVTHSMVAAFLEWAIGHFGHRPGDRVSGHPPLHFDLSTFDVYGSLWSGCELHLVPGDLLLPTQIAAWMRDARLTQWFSVPSTFTYMARFRAVEQDDFPTLERVLWCGEVLPVPVLAHWMERVPHPRYTNLYGPTETAIASTFHGVAQPPAVHDPPVPIGIPCAGEQALVLDEDLVEVPDGQVGELCISGAGVSPGYWRDDERTRESFTEAPGRRMYRTGDLAHRDVQGVLHFRGRRDQQIKSRGYRIELGEIERALLALSDVSEGAIVALPSDGFEGTVICCAWSGADRPPAHPRAGLADALPSYMLPSRWRRVEELPRNVNGKIDRPALQQLFASASDG